MLFKSKKRTKLLNGVYLNKSKSGTSLTVGMKGLSVNLGDRGVFINTPNGRKKISDNNQLDNKINNVSILPKLKSKKMAIIIGILFIFIGGHNFYLGNIKKGILSLLFCFTLIPLILSIIDIIKLTKMYDDDFNKKYNLIDIKE